MWLLLELSAFGNVAHDVVGVLFVVIVLDGAGDLDGDGVVVLVGGDGVGCIVGVGAVVGSGY